MRKDLNSIIYCDHAATTPIDQQVVQEISRIHEHIWGNASSIHQVGREAKVELELARETIAQCINAARNEILFTSGGTESDNLAIRGLAQTLKDKGRHIITSAVEHHAVLHTCAALEKQGFEVSYLDVDKFGMVQPDSLRSTLRDDTILVSIMHANNEIGTINPIAMLADIAHEADAFFHTDAVQTLGKISVDVTTLNLDALSASGHKIYGPKGSGFLYLNKQLDILPQLTGGAQERNLRAGTENLPAIAGLAIAVKLAVEMLSPDSQSLLLMQRTLEEVLADKIDRFELHGHPQKRIPGLSHIGFDGVDGESLVMNLDMRNIAVSSGSACSSGSINPSHVLLAMGFANDSAKSAIRISLGRSNSREQIPVLADAIAEEVHRIRSAREKKSETVNESV